VQVFRQRAGEVAGPRQQQRSQYRAAGKDARLRRNCRPAAAPMRRPARGRCAARCSRAGKPRPVRRSRPRAISGANHAGAAASCAGSSGVQRGQRYLHAAPAWFAALIALGLIAALGRGFPCAGTTRLRIGLGLAAASALLLGAGSYGRNGPSLPAAGTGSAAAGVDLLPSPARWRNTCTKRRLAASRRCRCSAAS